MKPPVLKFVPRPLPFPQQEGDNLSQSTQRRAPGSRGEGNRPDGIKRDLIILVLHYELEVPSVLFQKYKKLNGVYLKLFGATELSLTLAVL